MSVIFKNYPPRRMAMPKECPSKTTLWSSIAPSYWSTTRAASTRCPESAQSSTRSTGRMVATPLLRQDFRVIMRLIVRLKISVRYVFKHCSLAFGYFLLWSKDRRHLFCLKFQKAEFDWHKFGRWQQVLRILQYSKSNRLTKVKLL